jgi:hypothetical protein
MFRNTLATESRRHGAVYMWVISCALNVALFSVMCIGFYSNARWVRAVFGLPSASRSTLFAIYLAALFFSLILLTGAFRSFVLPLLVFQVSSVIAMPFTLQKVRHPIVVTYLIVSIVHSIAIVQLWNSTPI